MNKSILLLETPTSCKECPLRINDGDFFTDCMICTPSYTSEVYTSVDEHYEKGTKPNWCPLRPLPSYKDLTAGNDLESRLFYHFNQGYNTCLQEMEGGEND